MKRMIVMLLTCAMATARAFDDTDTVSVVNYSWLQLPNTAPFAGSSSQGDFFVDDPIVSGGGTMWTFRYGASWGPNYPLLTEEGYGTADYWAGLRFSEPRNVHTVEIDYWVPGDSRCKRFRIEGSLDGVAFDEIGLVEFEDAIANEGGTAVVSVTNDMYKAIRVRLKGVLSQPEDEEDYSGTYGVSFSRIEPFGDGLVAWGDINCANQDVFGTVASCTAGYNWLGFNDGTFRAQGSVYVGSGLPWPEGAYFQVDLVQTQRIVMSTLVAGYGISWERDSILLEVSNDGVDFLPVPPPTLYLREGESPSNAITYRWGEPIEARYWRVVGIGDPLGGGYSLFKQWLLYQTQADPPKPPILKAKDIVVTVGVAGKATITFEDVDDGSVCPNGETLLRTLSRTEFGYRHIGNAVPVTYTIQNSITPLSTNIIVTVLGDPALGEMIPVYDYNWFQLRSNQIAVAAYLLGDDLSFGEQLSPSHGTYDHEASVEENYAVIDNRLRWGARWRPASYWAAGAGGTTTGDGASNYCAKVTFSEPRNVHTVSAQWDVESPVSLSRYFVDGTADGEVWEVIGEKSFDPPAIGSGFIDTLPVTNGTYAAIRVRLMAGDYEAAPSGDQAGGPGFYAIEPIGDGIIASHEANWANAHNFLTTLTLLENFDYPGPRVTDGNIFIYGNYPSLLCGKAGGWLWPDAAQIDLGAVEWIDAVTILWDSGYYATTATILVSEDGETFSEVDDFATDATNVRSLLTFAPVKARYVRLTDATGPGGWGVLFRQMFIMGCKNPARGTVIIVR
ncbi:MAG: discoidin domain-containing protein [Kiritimatiellaeota bacterium]|nr:discoidin domain-containing protein [Kiritimatiellota bacterium]